MDPLTIVAITSVPALILAFVFSRSKTQEKKKASVILDGARARARQREEERAFADTTPAHDPYCSSLEFAIADGLEVDDRYDGRGKLTDEQINAIGLIFDGYRPAVKQTPKHLGGLSVLAVAGVPFSQSVFGDDNHIEPAEVEYIEPDFKMPE